MLSISRSDIEHYWDKHFNEFDEEINSLVREYMETHLKADTEIPLYDLLTYAEKHALEAIQPKVNKIFDSVRVTVQETTGFISNAIGSLLCDLTLCDGLAGVVNSIACDVYHDMLRELYQAGLVDEEGERLKKPTNPFYTNRGLPYAIYQHDSGDIIHVLRTFGPITKARSVVHTLTFSPNGPQEGKSARYHAERFYGNAYGCTMLYGCPEWRELIPNTI